MKRFLLFAGEEYYPNGGMEDFVDSFESLEDAKIALDNRLSRRINCVDWGHIFDCESGKIVVEKWNS